MANYRTPGVYVEEISKFPPSVAQVETAIPAFIGYTEKAEKRNGESLTNEPKRISSILEYETYFGGADAETSIEVIINDVVTDNGTERSIKVVPPSSPSPYRMYYSLQLYFANGGGPCYINSVGDYSTGIVSKTDLSTGLGKIRKVDEPTLLLFPDATNISVESDYWGLMQDSLAQCGTLQDRFAIIDTYAGTDPEEMTNDISGLRDNIGSEYLKYGAAYYPYIETILDYSYDENAILISHTTTSPNAVPYALDSLETEEPLITNKIVDLRDLSGLPAALTGTLPYAIDYMNAVTGFNLSNPGSEDFSSAKADAFVPILETALEDLNALIERKETVKADTESVISSLDENSTAANNLQTKLNTFLADFEGANKIEETTAALQSLYEKLQKDNTDTRRGNTILNGDSNLAGEMVKLLAYTVAVGPVYNVTTDLFLNIDTNIDDIIADVSSADIAQTDTNNGNLNGRRLGKINLEDNVTYNKIKAEINGISLILPPSSAMAGVYARTDSNFGVWKAPANTALSYVIRPCVPVTSEQQGDLNIDTVAGKSVNAIRSFTGKGTLVWGARTLDGNDNEWRYISVRRFFNMVEESVSKASEQFVFEGNDANTWVRVRAMIENFLVLQWKAGALAGAKAEQAFYVRVGLGQTMTAQDILEGRMIIEIGMAVVRPAEFIILRFSHKMQEA